MLQRRSLLAAARLVGEGQGMSLVQGFSRQQQWQQLQPQGLLPPAAAAAGVPPLPSGLRWHSELAERKPGPQEVVYEGPFRTAVKRVKKLSLFSCVCAVGAGPIILGLDTATTLTAKASIVGTLATFGIFTTGLLTWFTQPYIHRLSFDPSSGTVDVTTLTLLAKPRNDRFHISEVQEADTVHPLTSFQARGRLYYVDADHFPDKALLARLVPKAAAAHAMGAAEAAVHSLQGQQQQQAQQQQGGEQQQQQQAS